MKQSDLFTKTRKEAPSDEPSLNAQLLIKGGFIAKELAGAYAYMPLGLRVLNKIIGIIREEMNEIGGQEVHLSSLQQPELWEKSGRWNDDVLDVWFKTKLKSGKELGLATTHEEPLTNLMKSFIKSYKDLPVYPYQFQRKFRNELRAKSGILRTREFVMKDLYSFSATHDDLDKFYQKAMQAYKNIFDKCGIGKSTYLTFASGGSFSKYSHEFQTVCEAGEDIIYIDDSKKIAINKEVYNDTVLNDLGIDKKNVREAKSIEVGNIFKLGDKFSSSLGLDYVDSNGKKKPVIMGSYGIGPNRLMGTIAELNNDKNGIVWPKTVAPFRIHLVSLARSYNDNVYKIAEKLYLDFKEHNIEILWDNRLDVSFGSKFADADLLGIPVRFVLSEKTIIKGLVEIADRLSGKTGLEKLESILSLYLN